MKSPKDFIRGYWNIWIDQLSESNKCDVMIWNRISGCRKAWHCHEEPRRLRVIVKYMDWPGIKMGLVRNVILPYLTYKGSSVETRITFVIRGRRAINETSARIKDRARFLFLILLYVLFFLNFSSFLSSIFNQCGRETHLERPWLNRYTPGWNRECLTWTKYNWIW